MDDDELKSDRETCERASDGPWYATTATSGWPMMAVAMSDDREVAQTGIRTMDAEFIAAARTRWPAALDEIDRLRAENETLRGIMRITDVVIPLDADDRTPQASLEAVKRVVADLARVRGVLAEVLSAPVAWPDGAMSDVRTELNDDLRARAEAEVGK